MRVIMLAFCFALALPAAAQPGQPRGLSGDWRGTGLQVGPDGVQSSWKIQLSITADNKAEITYPSLGCRATLHPTAATSSQIVFREEIIDGDCIDGGYITALPLNGRLFWFWTSPGTPADASAVLYPDNLVS